MKMNILVVLFAFFCVVFNIMPYGKVLAVTSTPTKNPSPTPSGNQVPTDSVELEKIQRIKDLVASKVAELNLVERRGIIGSVREVSNMRVTITDVKGNSRLIEVDELTDFDDLASEGISDLLPGTMYSFVGLYNKDTQTLLARSINSVETIPSHFEGALVQIDEKSFQLHLVDDKGEKKIVDIQNSTRTSLATSDGNLVRSGFSKLEINERIHAIGFWDEKNKDLLTATRVIHFESIPPSKEMQSHINLSSQPESEE